MKDLFSDLDPTGDAASDAEEQAQAGPAVAPATAMDADAVLALTDGWVARGWLRALDRALARFFHREAPDAPPLLLLGVALTSHQLGRGHVCLDLGLTLGAPDLALSLPPEGDDLSDPPPLPSQVLAGLDLETWQAALDHPALVADAASGAPGTTPLVIEHRNGRVRLYLRRYWQYERDIRRALDARLHTSADATDNTDPAGLRQALDALFGPGEGAAPDWQKLACALAVRSPFAVITGGPGTGKTTTVVNLLAALQAVAGESPERHGRKYRIRLAAPTGKAAARLNESIGGAVSRLPLAQLPGNVQLDDIPTKVTTLHRLLGSRPDTRRFRHNRDNPLLVDILVIDEASMVDVDLMASVFDALPASAQLILLGDKDQLASVDAGAVLGELCQRALQAHYTPDTAQWLEAITGARVPDALVDPQGQPMDQAVAMLRKSYRFQQDSGIRALAEAVNSNALDNAILQQSREAAFEDVIWLNGHTSKPDMEATLEQICRHAITGTPEAFRNGGQGRVVNDRELPLPVGYRHYLELMQGHDLNADSAREDWDALAIRILEAFNDFQMLCALRKGPWGVEGLNDRIARQLLAEKRIPRAEGWYAGRPVLVTGNDYNLGLMNGDIGITFSVPWDKTGSGEPKETLRVAFPSGDSTGGIRWISPSRLQQLETVYAMTVHKSQGSEFNHTCLVLPDRLSPVLTKELTYTGITRAKNWFSLITGDARVFKDSVGQQVVRASGLALRLGANE